ncbi:MAG: glycosyltransferase family A protein [Methylohalobius sp.]
MLYRLKDRFHRFCFAQACREVYSTAPLALKADQPIALLTQLQHKDVLLFLIALKSLARFVLLREVLVLNDGSLTQQDQETLKKHTLAQIFPIDRFRHPRCPRGGTWERLLAIAHFNQDRYVIQLDSDTLTRAPVPEVGQHLEHNTAFILGTWDKQEIEPMRTCCERVQKNHPNPQTLHVQLAAEAGFSGLKAVDELKYVRGCSGFCGFPKGTVNLDFIVHFSQAMEAILGAKWHAWGSEQVMTNVLIANAPKAAVLPHPDYSDCIKMKENTRFIHFIGTCRFRGGKYAKEARQAIAELKRHAG